MRPAWGRLIAGLMALLPLTAIGEPLGYAAGFNALYRVDLATGATTVVGAIGFSDVEGLAISPNGVLYAVADAGVSSGSGSTDLLIRINPTTGAGTLVGIMPGLAGQGPSGNLDYGLAFTCDARLWLTSDSTSQLWEVMPSNASTRLVGNLGQPISGLAARGNQLYGVSVGSAPALFRVDRDHATASLLGPLNVGGVVEDAGLDFDASGTLWATLDPEPAAVGASRFAQIDVGSGRGHVTASSSVSLVGMEGLAIARPGGCGAVIASGALQVPGPGMPLLVLLGALALGLGLRRLDRA